MSEFPFDRESAVLVDEIVPSQFPYLPEVGQSANLVLKHIEQEVEVLEELFRAMLEELMTGRLSAVPLVSGLAEVSA